MRHAREIGLEAIEARVGALATELRDRLGGEPGVTLHDQGERRCGIVTLRGAGEASSETARRSARNALRR